MKRLAVVHRDRQRVEVIEEECPAPRTGQVLVKTHLSGISAGSEMLVYKGQVERNLAVDASLPALAGNFEYPFKYGYSCAGEVVECGEGVDAGWIGKRVFAFNPHESMFTAFCADCIPLPDGAGYDQGVFLPNMETAVNLVQDGAALIGERVAVFGLGVVGLLTLTLLIPTPALEVVAFEPIEKRRQFAGLLGAERVFDPGAIDWSRWQTDLAGTCLAERGADLAFEVSGSRLALNQAITVSGFGGRVVLGSWYGSTSVEVLLGSDFHRSRIQMISSQVSTIAPKLSGRWSKQRRINLALGRLTQLDPEKWISNRFPVEDCARAFQLLAEDPREALQIVLTYP